MKKSLLGISLCLLTTPALADNTYETFKKDLYDKTGLSFSGDISVLGQRGAPGGNVTPWQTLYYAEVDWDAFKSSVYGNGSFKVSYTNARYYLGRHTAAEMISNVGVAADANDYSGNHEYLTDLSYTHRFAGSMDRLAVTVGQFPMYTFDGNAYLSNQQVDFNNLSMSQNASYVYPAASAGAYLTINPTDEWTVYAGFQDAQNIPGNNIEFDTMTGGKYTGFAAAYYEANIAGLGNGRYGGLFYHQPSVEKQPKESYGWSLNFSQDVGDKWAVFGRADGSTDSAYLKQSYVLGGAYKNPFERNESDMVAAAVGVNMPNRKMFGQDTRNLETVFETYYDFALSKYLLITPDFQMYLKPAVDRDTDVATVYSIRFTMIF